MLYIIIIIILINLFLFYHFPKYPKLNKKQQYDCAIVLGYPANDDGSISTLLKDRMDHAIDLYHKKQIKKMILSGAGVKNNFKEAHIMKEYALANEVKEKDIILEDQALNTFDNLRLSKQIVLNNNFQSIVVISNHFHLLRASYFVSKFFNHYVMSSLPKINSIHLYVLEYFRMWNSLYYEYIVLPKKK